MKTLKTMGLLAIALAVVLLAPATLFAQTTPTSVTFSGAAVGAGLGMALTIIGAGYGLGRIGSAALESMALGVPVVATNRGGVSDIIRSPEEGLMADPNDPEAMATAVLRVLEDAELRETLRRNGRNRARDFDMVRVARHTASVYQQLLAAKSDA